MSWFIFGLRHYVDFDGRASRREYWNHYSAGSAVGLVLMLLGALIHPVLWLAGLYQIATLVPLVAVTVRRLHDSNLSGRWVGVYLLSSICLWGAGLLLALTVGRIFEQAMNGDLATLLDGSAETGLSGVEAVFDFGSLLSGVTLYLMCRKSTPGANTYGAPAFLEP